MIELKHFEQKDFKYLVKWIDNERDLIQFAGHIFYFPITKNQIKEYLKDNNRIAFKITYSKIIIGHAEIYIENKDNVKLCRILIGDLEFRGKGLGKEIIKKLIEKSFIELKVNSVNLNVYDWNVAAIKCYTKSGMKINKGIVKETKFGEENWKAINMSISKNEWVKSATN